MAEGPQQKVSIVRGRLLSFHREPLGADDPSSFTHIEDGAIVCMGGLIAWAGDWADLPADHRGAPVTDHRPHLIVPGFIDPHIHFPQGQVVASYAGSLLEWLNSYTFIEEQRYGDPPFAAAMAKRFCDMLLAHGTTTAVAFGSVHKASAQALLAEAAARNMRLVTGKVMMDRNAPEALTDTAQTGHDDTKALIEEWHGAGRLEVAISPRFALTSTDAQMEAAGALAREHPDCLIQTHLSENHGEIEAVEALFPDAVDYTDVYERFGLLTPKSLMGHCIHLSDREIGRMAETGAVAVFCPTSNLFLGSGLFDLDRIKGGGVRHAIATDIGGGTSWSLLKTLDEGYKVLNLQGHRFHPYRAFWQATRGNAEAIGMADRIGTLDAGTEADFVVLDAAATDAMALRMERAETLAEELFVLQTLGDDRAVKAVYVAGAEASASGPS
ncbi:MAG: guanine deaminase [Roseitalea porphyridii]|uniref:guanine deaminase n=1 Tax=Roseitalea porphyridii TaxID=1852022 RepID=UPI0032D91751